MPGLITLSATSRRIGSAARPVDDAHAALAEEAEDSIRTERWRHGSVVADRRTSSGQIEAEDREAEADQTARTLAVLGVKRNDRPARLATRCFHVAPGPVPGPYQETGNAEECYRG